MSEKEDKKEFDTLARAEVPIAYTELNDTTVVDEKRKGDNLIRWLNANGCNFPHLYFEYLAIDYRGVMVDCDMKNDDIMLEISPECLLTIEVAKASPIGQQIIKSGCRTRSTHSYVACFMLEEKLNPESYWAPYVDIMPKSYDHMPVFWTAEEMAYLKGSLCVPEIEYRKNSYRTEYKNICRYVPEFGQRHTEADFIWGRLVVLTRIFGITINGRKTSSMVPMADMLNHKRPPETYWTFDNERNAFTITATKDFKKGEVVYDSYGRKCNTEFLMNYGFVAEGNLFNTAKVSLRMPPNDPLYQTKLRLLGRDRRKLEFQADYDKDTTLEAWSFCRVAIATEAELDDLTGGSRYYRPNTKRIKPINLRNEMAAIRFMAGMARESLALFDTTLAEDEKLLENKSLSRNIQNAIRVRMCEKKVLGHWVSFETVLLPLLDAKRSCVEAEQAIRQCEAIQGVKHFRHYVNLVISPLLVRETTTIGALVESLEKMEVTPRAPDSPRFSSDSDF